MGVNRNLAATARSNTMRSMVRYAIGLIAILVFGACATTHEEARSPDERKTESLEVSGYVRTEASGIWKYGFERSEFVPADRPNEKWWLKLPSRWWERNKDSALVRKGVDQDGAQVRASGFLSPAGRYGHLGAYDHEFVAEVIEEVGVKN